MSGVLYTAYTLACLLLVGWGVTVWWQTRQIGTVLIILVALGVAYDNLILSLGNTLGAGRLLRALSVPRFVLHQLVLPWIIYAAFEQARLAGHGWAGHPAAGWIALALVLVVTLLGVLSRLRGLRLESAVMDGVTRYVAVGTLGPPLVSILSIGAVGIVGLLLWCSSGWPWIFGATVLVFLGEGIPVQWIRRGLGSGLELLFLAVMLVTDLWLARGGAG